MAVSPQSISTKLGGAPIQYLTKQHDSWFILAKGFLPSTSAGLEEQWDAHPENKHELKVFGKVCHENRFSQQWSATTDFAYNYSGSSAMSKSYLDDDTSPSATMVRQLVETCNEITETDAYNAILQNWYDPTHTIGLHSDDEKQMKNEFPIFSLSWGGTRRFLFRPKSDRVKSDLLFEKMLEVYLADGDLLVMGGKAQDVTKHEVPKFRKTMDPSTGRRVNWTIRAMDMGENTERKRKAAELDNPQTQKRVVREEYI
ncbi:hypothetical protein TrVE_jg3794 [Triparma verrucosa]|nr:hypothetical protein TrVE_jg3794 [Triparma verrucosa]